MELPKPKIDQATPYMTRIPDRRPEYKAHAKLGQAKNAINYRVGYAGAACDMELYQWEDGEWVLMYSVIAGDTEVPWRRESQEKTRAAMEERRKREEQERDAKARYTALERWQVVHEQWFDGSPEDFIAAFMEGYRYKDK